jgi:hypothetical protein
MLLEKKSKVHFWMNHIIHVSKMLLEKKSKVPIAIRYREQTGRSIENSRGKTVGYATNFQKKSGFYP